MHQHPDKNSLRRRYADLRGGLTPEERAAAEAAICDRLFSLPAWREAVTVCGYISVRGELNTRPILERAAAEGKTVALPVTVTSACEGRMVFRALPNGDFDRLTPARFGIPEPDESCPALTHADLTRALILVPALAFDEAGYRLGWGGGYYDRFLDNLREADIPVATVGLVFSACRAELLPRESHDIPVHTVIDERRITHTHGAHSNP